MAVLAGCCLSCCLWGFLCLWALIIHGWVVVVVWGWRVIVHGGSLVSMSEASLSMDGALLSVGGIAFPGWALSLLGGAPYVCA